MNYHFVQAYFWEQMGERESFTVDKKVDTSIYDDYVGRYDYGANDGILEVTREGERLFAQIAMQEKFEIFPRSETEFFFKIVNAQVTFMKNDQGEVKKVMLYQGGVKIEAPKVK